MRFLTMIAVLAATLLLSPSSQADDAPPETIRMVKARYCWCSFPGIDWTCYSIPVEYEHCFENPGCLDPRKTPPADAPKRKQEIECYRRDKKLQDEIKREDDKQRKPKPGKPMPFPKISRGACDTVRMATL